MRKFMIRVAGILMLLATVLLLEGLSAASLPLLAAFCLLPLSVMLTVRLLRDGAHSRARNRRRTSARYRRARMETAAIGARNHSRTPALRVATGPHRPDGPRVA
ncbi:hypothetical protein LJC60_09165 [Ruminococcaceae bacterium OttesenSCG-928-D13]|nr:hypothetical protein [Ruminococcaceae bacterium OttesenSCG-928-D13]